MEEYLEFAKTLARYAGSVMKKYFYEEQGVQFKSDRTPVTVADKMINDYVIEKVKDKYPLHSVYGEEAKYIIDSKYMWVCDPIDGTSMYTRHVPVSVFSLCLVIDGVPSVGVVYDPYLDEMYTAIKGCGAYVNGEKIHVNEKRLGEIGASVDICMWNNVRFDTIPLMESLRSSVKTCQVGSTAHASMLVARGCICAEVFPGCEHGHCDMAASVLIVREAGGVVTDFYGNDQKYDRDINGCVLSNGLIHDDIIKKVRELKL